MSHLPRSSRRDGKVTPHLVAYCALLILLGRGSFADGIEISDRYWSYQGQKVLLIGGWNHGHNPFLDHDTMDADGVSGVSTEEQITAAMDEMVDAGGNLLRCVLDPGVGAGIQGFDFCAKSGELYDLRRMAGPYWTRLDFFLSQAQARAIIVQIEIWDRFDWYNGGHKGWPASPFNPKNNINYTTATSGLLESYEGKGDRTGNPFGWGTPGQTTYVNADKQRKAQYDLVRSYQERFIDKLLSVTFAYDNVLYSANNEVRHQEPAWGRYWMRYIRGKAASQGKTVLCTDMFWDLLDLPGPSMFDYLMANADFYDYFDVSQVSAQRNKRSDSAREVGQKHWTMVSHAAAEARTVHRLLHMNKIYGSRDRDGGWMGSADNAVGEFWRGLIAGVAAVRFHRPDSGIGLSTKSKNCMRATRLIESKVKFWEVNPRQDLLSECGQDEAYVAAQPGEKYVLYFTEDGNDGSVLLNLKPYRGTSFTVYWVNIETGHWGPAEQIAGGRLAPLRKPGPGHQAAAIVRSKPIRQVGH